MPVFNNSQVWGNLGNLCL